MPGKVIIVSYGELAQLISRLAATIETDVQIEAIDALHTPALELVREKTGQNSFAVFLSSGGMYRILSEHIQTGLLEIKVTGFDFLMAVKRASQHYKQLAIVHYTMTPFLPDILDILTIPVRQVNLRDHTELDRELANLKQEGIEAVIGGSLVCEKAAALQLGSYLIYSTESVLRALESAIAMAQTRFVEVQKAMELQALLDVSREGMIAVDRLGLIKSLNPSAGKLLGLERDTALGMPVAAVCPEVKLERVLESARPELNQLETIRGATVVVNRIPILIREEVTGALATLHDAGSIRKAEAKIRESLRKQPFRAKVNLKDVLGASESIQRAKEKAALFARTDSAILIVGESGTGKELFAQAIHNGSRRAAHPFVAINCAALPENLLESELFGHEEGAFTGARKGGKPGLFELAHQGTLFLDELSSLPLHLQAKLLRVIQEKEVMRVGADYVIPLDVRIISSSNQDLRDNIKQGSFRSDLFYRLSTLDLVLPPLRERQSDILPLFWHFAEKHRSPLDRKVLPDTLSLALQEYHWPGNIRELANTAEKFVVLGDWQIDPGELLGTRCQSSFRPDQRQPANLHCIGNTAQLQAVEQLEQAGFNRTEIARMLGISRTGLWKKLKRHRPEKIDPS